MARSRRARLPPGEELSPSGGHAAALGDEAPALAL
jgi:hypothetical protein